mgnify:CR=1 FL=1
MSNIVPTTSLSIDFDDTLALKKRISNNAKIRFETTFDLGQNIGASVLEQDLISYTYISAGLNVRYNHSSKFGVGGGTSYSYRFYQSANTDDSPNLDFSTLPLSFRAFYIYSEKLDLLLKIRDNEIVNWSGKFRPDLVEQAIYPRPIQDPLPIWVGVGGTPESFVRAGVLGLPLMVAIIGGETHRFAPLVELYRNAGEKAGHDPEKLKVGVHSLGYVAETREQAINDFFPGYAESFTRIGRERGWPPVTMSHFESQIGPTGALVVGDVELFYCHFYSSDKLQIREPNI